MDWEQLREATLGEVANTLVTEGVGVGAGFIGASTIGRRIEDYMLPTGVDGTSWSSIIKGWAYNNAPKLAAWYVIRKYVPTTPETRTQEMLMDAKKAIAGSVVFDTLLRTTNHGMPVHDPSGYKLLGGKGEPIRTAAPPQADMQRLIQENSALRTELNKALQRLAAPAPVPQPVYVQAPAPAPQPVYAPAPAPQPIHVQAPAPAPQPIHVQAPTPAPQPIHVQAPAPQPVYVQAQAPQPVQVRHVAPPPQVHIAPVQAAPIVNVAPIQAAPAPAAPVVRYQPAPAPARMAAPPVVRIEQQQPVPPEVSERERRFAFMPTPNAPPDVQERERKYGFAGKSSEKEIATMFGML